MKITVKVKPGSPKNGVSKIDESHYVVRVKAPPVEGRANEELIEVLADHFQQRKREIVILRGAAGRTKIVEVI
jgi:uncharacterized protein